MKQSWNMQRFEVFDDCNEIIQVQQIVSLAGFWAQYNRVSYLLTCVDTTTEENGHYRSHRLTQEVLLLTGEFHAVLQVITTYRIF